MNKYKVTYNEKECFYIADSATEAIAKLSNRRVFGRELLFGYKINLISADDHGVEWAEAWTIREDFTRRIFAVIVDGDIELLPKLHIQKQ